MVTRTTVLSLLVALAAGTACAPASPPADTSTSAAPAATSVPALPAPEEAGLGEATIAKAESWGELLENHGATRRVNVGRAGHAVRIIVDLSPCARNAGVFITATVEGSSNHDPADVRLSVWDARTRELIVRAKDVCHDNFFMATPQCVLGLNEFWNCAPREVVVLVENVGRKESVDVSLMISMMDNPR